MDRKNKNGFTIIELLVVTAIIAIISAMVLANYRSGEKQYIFNQAMQKLVSDLRKAQNMAVSGSGIAGRYCGYGILIKPAVDYTSYTFYGDIPPGGNCGISNNKYDSSDYSETVNLAERVLFNSSSPSPLDVFFKAPEPTTYINQVSQYEDNEKEGTVILEYEGESALTKTIRINVHGLIQTE